MSGAWLQVVSILGACLVLAAYGLQHFRLLSADGAPYLLMNFVGGAALCFVAVLTRQMGFIIMEGAWVLISLHGILRLRRAG
ncbi:MAG TPA: hypothetical protein VF507_00730 [Pyrinomonadaceae bacterium]